MATQQIDELILMLERMPLIDDTKDYSVEICVDSVESANNAYLGGADRLELCSSLIEGGLTPSIGTIIQVLKSVQNIHVHIMIRPRNGDFLYNKNEMEIILTDIQHIIQLKQTGLYPNLKGIVSGFLDKNGNVDIDNLSLCLDQIKDYELEFTFHRAMDMSKDVMNALDICMQYGVDRVLTSGQEKNVELGFQSILNMIQYVKQKGNKMRIAIGGGIHIDNIHNIVTKQNKIQHIHGTFRSIEKGGMEYKQLQIHMGAHSVNGNILSEYDHKYANIEMIKHIVNHMHKIHN